MKKLCGAFVLFLLIGFLPACKKQETIFDALTGDWGLVEATRNGIVYHYMGDEYTWAIYGCDHGCSASIIYTMPTQGNYDMSFNVSPDEKWLIKNNGDSLEIMGLKNGELLTRFRALGILEIDLWNKK